MSTYTVVDPATGDRVAEYPEVDAAGLEDALRRVAAAYTSWGRASTPDERAALLHRVAELHRERSEELAGIIVREMGKPVQQARDEVGFAADIIDYYADNGPALMRDQPIEPLVTSAVKRLKRDRVKSAAQTLRSGQTNRRLRARSASD